MSGISEEELIKQITPYFKQAGFRKKNKRWTKDLGEFTLIFFIQGSCCCKEDYYIRPGVKVNHADDGKTYYGDFWTELPITDADTIIREFETFCAEWTDKRLIKQRVLQFLEWEKRNPLEKRRAGLVDYQADPVPSAVLFSVRQSLLDDIVKNY